MWLKFPAGATPFKVGRELGVWCLVLEFGVISGNNKSCKAFMQISDTIIACYRVYPEKNQPLRPFEKEIFSYSMNYKSSSFLK